MIMLKYMHVTICDVPSIALFMSRYCIILFLSWLRAVGSGFRVGLGFGLTVFGGIRDLEVPPYAGGRMVLIHRGSLSVPNVSLGGRVR